jgi:hypothetical protein
MGPAVAPTEEHCKKHGGPSDGKSAMAQVRRMDSPAPADSMRANPSPFIVTLFTRTLILADVPDRFRTLDVKGALLPFGSDEVFAAARLPV